ncbi:MAG: glycosyltransferase family 2 protein [Candidatus Omnitrophota bacterium]
MPELSVVILTSNSIGTIGPCLDSVFSQDYKDREVIVVDNGSSDRTQDFIKRQYPAVILLENKENLGAAKARNQGIDIARGNWVFTQDCDVVLENGFFPQAIAVINSVPFDTAMIQPKILCADKKTIYSCGIYLSRILKRFYDIGRGKIDRGHFSVRKYIFGACSAAAFYRRKMLDEVRESTGYFDERFFFLVEDVDLSWRLQRNGYKALYAPDAVCYHQGNSSLTNAKMRQYLCWRNRKYLLAKLKLNKALSALIFLIYDLPRYIFLILTNPFVRTNNQA